MEAEGAAYATYSSLARIHHVHTLFLLCIEKFPRHV